MTAPFRLGAALLALLFALLYLATAPDVVNPDGLGYLKLLPHNFAAGHLAFMPLLRAATRLLGGDGLRAGRLLDAVLGALGVALTFDLTAVLGSPRSSGGAAGAAFAAAGLGLSYGYWVEAADVEAYAAATVALLIAVRSTVAYAARPSAGRALTVGACLGLAVLCHLTHLLLAPLCAVSLTLRAPTRRLGAEHAALALTLGGVLTLVGYGYAAFAVRHHDLAGALSWVSTASHGFRSGGGIYRLGDAAYGLSKAVIFSPYLYETDAPRLLGQFILGLLPLTVLLFATRTLRVPPRERWIAIAWAVPYALVGVLFFGSDSERWLFILPLLWIAAARVLEQLPARRRAGVGAAALLYVGLLNLATGILPAHEDTWTRRRAEVVASLLRDGDLVVFPGHSWDEYVSFYSRGRRIEPLPLVYYAARDGANAAFERLDHDAARVRQAGGSVYALRFFDEREEDPRGWDELKALGLGRAVVRARLAARFHPVELSPIQGLSLTRLDPARAER